MAGPVPAEYVEGLNAALRSTIDVWGTEAVEAPDGPSRGNVGGRLVPLMLGDRLFLTASGFPYIVCTDTVGSDTYALHVIDGSQVLAEFTPLWSTPNWDVPFPRSDRSGDAAPHFTFRIGAEVFGQASERLRLPVLGDGWLPVLQVEYTDDQGARWQHESFAGIERVGGVLASWVRLARLEGGGAPAQLAVEVAHQARDRMAIDDRGVLHLDGLPFVLGPPGGQWDGERLSYVVDPVDSAVTLCLLNQPAQSSETDMAEVAGAGLDSAYDAALAAACDYWHSVREAGTSVGLPDPEAQNAVDNLLVQNLMTQERYSIGNPYEFVFTMEGHESVEALLAWGFVDDARAALQRLVHATNGRGPEWYESWERGVKLSAVGRYTSLSGDASLLRDNLEVYQGYRQAFEAQLDADPHGLLAPERYAWDIADLIYGWHSQACAWRGLVDVADALARSGDEAKAAAWEQTAARLLTGLRKAMDERGEWLDDGSYFIPVSLLGDETPYASLTESRLASYWNLVAPYALATGAIPPESPEGRGLLEYMKLHGSWFLGLTRFNGIYDPPTPIGEVAPGGTGGYKTTGIDNAWGVQAAKYLAMCLDGDRLALTLLSKLCNGMTPGTFLDGEATTVGYAPDDVYRSTWYPPNSTSNALYLLVLRDALLYEERTESGRHRVHVGMGLPREWLAPGAGVRLGDAPTSLGPVSLALTPAADGAGLHVSVDGPEPADPVELVVHLRTPGGRMWSLPAGAAPEGCTLDGETLVLPRWAGRLDLALAPRPA
jgi:hypothetical protein